ncbi:hypothetical protein CDAR_14061 [Caerostris darwini]|uniref:Uncharacterized protein n=1 Tax=Caerostris darwini TaxID=1538125 RepID=A0AAV4N6S1_9ARAC|nr:hypothetical protein CDAR_14061 [Caerostris darwini]
MNLLLESFPFQVSTQNPDKQMTSISRNSLRRTMPWWVGDRESTFKETAISLRKKQQFIPNGLYGEAFCISSIYSVLYFLEAIFHFLVTASHSIKCFLLLKDF